MEQTLARQIHVEHVMGTVVSIDVRGTRPAADSIARAVATLHDADRVFSTYREDSAIRRLDRGELTLAHAPADVRRVLARCAALERATGGAFDVHASGALDPSAYVKGWAAHRAANVLRAGGFRDVCVAAGGDVVARGERAPGLPWRIGVQHPRDPAAVAAIVEARDLAVATSGAYERGAHIVARGGGGPGGVLSVTVTGPDLGLADAYATAAFALGAGAPTLRLPHGYEAMTILADDRVLTTPGFPVVEEDR